MTEVNERQMEEMFQKAMEASDFLGVKEDLKIKELLLLLEKVDSIRNLVFDKEAVSLTVEYKEVLVKKIVELMKKSVSDWKEKNKK